MAELPLVTSETFFNVFGFHTCGDYWVPFTVRERFNRNLEDLLTVENQKIVTVGSWWQGPIGCGHNLRIQVVRSLDEHLVNNKRIFTWKNGQAQFRYTFPNCSGVAFFAYWSGGQQIMLA